MVGVWIMLLLTGQDPQLNNELQTIPFAISMAITSDILTAMMLLIAGFGLVRKNVWATKIFLLSMGLLFYSVVNAAGLYGQRGDTIVVVIFIIIFVFAVVFTISALQKHSENNLGDISRDIDQ